MKSILLCALLLPLPAAVVQDPTPTPALVGQAAEPAKKRGVDVTYIGNCGFLIEGHDGRVLIDALYSKGVGNYVEPTRERVEELRRAQGLYAAVDVLLASHHHADHFDVAMVVDHMHANEDVVFVSTAQAGEALAKHADLAARVLCQTPLEGRKVELEKAPIPITAMFLHHGRGRDAQNVGHLFELGGMKILHVGDMAAVADEIEELDLAGEDIDLAFIPSWMLAYGNWRKAVQEHIHADRVVIMHLPPPTAKHQLAEELGGWEKYFDKLREAHPNMAVLAEPLDQQRFEPRKKQKPADKGKR